MLSPRAPTAYRLKDDLAQNEFFRVSQGHTVIYDRFGNDLR